MAIISHPPETHLDLSEVNIDVEYVVLHFGRQADTPEAPYGFLALWEAHNLPCAGDHLTVVSKPFKLTLSVPVDMSLVPTT